MCQVNGPSYDVTCDHCDKSMRNTDDICPHCKHNYSGGTMSEQQVLPELPHELMVQAKSAHRRWHDIEAVRLILGGREDQLRTALASLAQSEAERERLQGEVVSANAGESLQSGYLWKAYQASGQTSAMTFSGWINWNIIEREKAEAELARERELNQGLMQVVKEYMDDCVVTGYGGQRCERCKRAYKLLEDKAKPVATGEEK